MHNETAAPLLDGLSGAYNVKLEAFEGPLDLLLHLIRKNEVDICDIPISTITRQYLEYIKLMKDLNLEIAGEFLVMASTLIQIKSRLLLPVIPDEESGEGEEDDPRAELVRRLLEYQRYKEAADDLGGRQLLGRDIFVRPAVPQEDEPAADQEAVEVELFELVDAFRRILSQVSEERFHEVGTDSISIADRINEIIDRLADSTALAFDDLFAADRGREYLVVTFLAVLELCKLKMVRVIQAERYGAIWIVPVLLDDEAGGDDDSDGV